MKSYIILSHRDKDKLADKVAEKLEVGYSVLGGVCMDTQVNCFHQAMILVQYNG